MRNTALKSEIMHHIVELLPEQQRKVLDFVRALETAKPRGVPGKSLLSFAGVIPPEDLRDMSEVIEQGCEKALKTASGQA